MLRCIAETVKRVPQARVAVQTPEQTPEGPVPFHSPTPRDRLNRPIPFACRGPATAFILVCPEAATMPATLIGRITNLPLVEEILPPVWRGRP